MKLKQRPEDFSVKESFRFEDVPGGRYRVYLMDKQKLSTFEAVARIRDRFGLRPGAVSYCGLKDKQGRTEQLIAVDAVDVDLQDSNLRLKYLGRTDRPLSAENTTSNRFAVTVRALQQVDIERAQLEAVQLARLGVINYFDSQRFGSLKHGQGYIAKDLIRGDFEAALKNYLAIPSPLDQSDDAKVKAFWAKHWGEWNRLCPYKANHRYRRVLESLRKAPDDFATAFSQIDADYRALILFTYQSYLWNETARRWLQLVFPRESLFPMPYQAGTLLFHQAGTREQLGALRTNAVPLFAPNTPPVAEPTLQEAITWVLGKEKLTLSELRIPKLSKIVFFKHEMRPTLVYPEKLVVGEAERDELNRGLLKVNVAFTLPPGSYATLVVKRLFHHQVKSLEPHEPRKAAAPHPGDGTHPPAGRARAPAGRFTARSEAPTTTERRRPNATTEPRERPSNNAPRTTKRRWAGATDAASKRGRGGSQTGPARGPRRSDRPR